MVFCTDLEVLQKFKQQLAVIERDAIWWMHVVVPKIMEIKPAEYVHWYICAIVFIVFVCSFNV